LLVAVLLIAGVGASGLAAFQVGSASGAYVGKVEVAVHPPPTPTIANPLTTPSANAVRFAGLIAEAATNGEEVPRVTAQDITLADQGMRHATLISLVNLGGQWANDFSRPFIRIEAVDTTPGAVRDRLQEGLSRVVRAMDHLQRGAQVRLDQRATAEAVPAVPQVWYEGTHRRRAMLVTFLLGLVITLQTCRVVARALTRRDQRRDLRTPSRAGHAPLINNQRVGSRSAEWEGHRSSHTHIVREDVAAVSSRTPSRDRSDSHGK
jgi:hypothetical protein